MKTKVFDCVEMKRRGAARIYQETKDMTFEEKAVYWELANKEFLRGDTKKLDTSRTQTKVSSE